MTCAPDCHGNRPLHNVREPEIAEALILHGADINAENDAGETPLDAHWEWGWRIADLIQKYGAVFNIGYGDD